MDVRPGRQIQICDTPDVAPAFIPIHRYYGSIQPADSRVFQTLYISILVPGIR